MRVGGSESCPIPRMILARPAAPAADSMCPKLVLAEPSRVGRSASRPRPSTCPIAVASMGSPRIVPVPWASM